MSFAKFKLKNIIDKNGATAEVVKAVEIESGKEVALKIINDDIPKSMKESF